MCIKVALYFEFKLAFIAIKLFHVLKVPETEMLAKDKPNLSKGKVMFVLYVCIGLDLYFVKNYIRCS